MFHRSDDTLSSSYTCHGAAMCFIIDSDRSSGEEDDEEEEVEKVVVEEEEEDGEEESRSVDSRNI